MEKENERINLSYKFDKLLDKIINYFTFLKFFKGDVYNYIEDNFIYDVNIINTFDGINDFITSKLKVEHEKYYPRANEWMWNYCIFFKKYKSKNGRNYDLGIYKEQNGFILCAIVYSNEPGDYNSNDFRRCKEGTEDRDFILETYKLALEKGYKI